MDFFDWINLPFSLIVLFTGMSSDASPNEVAATVMRANWICLGVGAAIFVLCLVLGGIGLNRLARTEGMKPTALSYLPFANTWVAGKIAGESSFFGQKMKRAGLYAMIFEILYSVLEGMRVIINLMLTRSEFYRVQTITGSDVSEWVIDRALIPANLQWQYDFLQYSEYVSYVLYFFAVVFFVVMYLALFRKYFSQRPVLMTVLCALFPFRGFVLFAIRNNAKLDYDEFMRRRNEEYMRRYGGGNYGNPPQPPQQDNDPFTEFKEDNSSDDVFKDL